MSEKIKKILKNLIKYTIFFFFFLNLVSYFKGIDLNKEKFSIQSFELIDGSNYEIKNDKPLLVNFDCLISFSIALLKEQILEFFTFRNFYGF